MSDNHSRRSFLRRSAAAVTAATAIATPVTAETHTESAASDAPYYEIEQAIHAEVNRRREDQGLDPLAYNANVAAAARSYSREMIADNFFSHTAPGDSSFAEHYRDDGVDCSSLGENILYRTRSAESPEGVAANAVNQWMGSAGHRENILGDWRSEGVGVAVTDDDVVYVTQGFGSCPGTDSTTATSTTTDEPTTTTTTDEPTTTTTTDEPTTTTTTATTTSSTPTTTTTDASVETDGHRHGDGRCHEHGRGKGRGRDHGKGRGREREHGQWLSQWFSQGRSPTAQIRMYWGWWK